MPVKIPSALPAYQVLRSENIFVMDEARALTQDIRPLRIVILNLMPLKETTETQLLRALGNTSLQVEPTFLTTSTYQSKNTDPAYLDAFYRTFDEIKDSQYDGFIITGAPIEHMKFEDVMYWEELIEIMDWADKNCFSTLHLCWGAMAALYYHYGIPSYPLNEKLSGIYRHRLLEKNVKLLRGFDDIFNAPHSRGTEVRREDIEKHDDLLILAESEEAGIFLIADRAMRHVYALGHLEYDADTLEKEYMRDLERGLNPQVPAHYYPGGDLTQPPLVTWRAHGSLLYGNWLNYCVYQETPYDIERIYRR
jgi:homoserine O-succinyltransferase